VEFCQFVQCQGINREPKTHTNHNMGWFSPKLTLTIILGDFHLKSQSTITLGDFHIGTMLLPLLSGLKSPRVSIPGVWVTFDKTWKWSMQTSAPHHWRLAREPRFVMFWWWTGSTTLSGLKVHVLNKMLCLHWLDLCLHWCFVCIDLNKMLCPFTTSARTPRSFFG